MKKVILTVVMAFTVLSVGLMDFIYAEDIAIDIPGLTEVEMDEGSKPMILAQEKSTTSNYQFSEPYDTKKVEKEEDEEEVEELEGEEYEEDDPDAGVRQKKRNKTRTEKVKQGKN